MAAVREALERVAGGEVIPTVRLGISHAAFSPERQASFKRLLDQLDVGQFWEVDVEYDHLGTGSLRPWLALLERAASSDATHFVFLPDDAILVPHFAEVLHDAIMQRPEHLLCFQSNHDRSPEAAAQGHAWYTTDEGFTAFGATMPIAWVREHLAWRKANLREGITVQGDEGVNLWAMATGRKVWKSLPSLVDHDTTLPSLDGNDDHALVTARRPLVWDPSADLRERDWGTPPVHLGRTYNATHWRLMYMAKQTPELIERAYDVDRQGPVASKPTVAIATPSFRRPAAGYRHSKKLVMRDLVRAGFGVLDLEMNGDALVTRGRHCLMHEFLRSPATHLLQWDDDIEALNPECVREMIATGHDIVGGAYPFRDGSGRVVANPLEGTGSVTIENACMPVRELGTGFLLTSRKAIVDLCARHPEEFYLADINPYVDAPMWALFDARLEDRGDGIKRYASEDWWFCKLAREAGYSVNVYLPPSFRHWGEWGHDGHITKAWSMKFEGETGGNT